jgi:hypothetical protein
MCVQVHLDRELRVCREELVRLCCVSYETGIFAFMPRPCSLMRWLLVATTRASECDSRSD